MPEITIQPYAGGGNFFDQFDAAPQAAPQQSPYANAIAKVESGGKYTAIGPDTGGGNRALGKYQVMASNVGPWSQEILGRQVSPQEFLAKPELQDQIFNAKFGGYVDKYGPEGAAKAWFAGERGMNDPNRRDILGTSVADYGRKFTAAMGPGTAQAAPPQPQAPRGGNFFDQFDGAGPAQQTNQQAPQSQPAAFDARFSGQPSKAAALDPKLEPALRNQAAEMTQGAPTSPGTSLAIDFQNQGSAAGQRTSPNVDLQSRNLISTETFQSDSGEILFRDPASGEVIPTDQNKHVVLRDPKDNTVKVFARTDDTNEGVLSSAGRLLGTGLAVGAPTARPAIGLAAAAKVQPKASDIFSTAKPFYRAFKSEAGKISVPPENAAIFADHIRRALDKANLIPELAPPVYSAVAIFDKGEPMTLASLQNVKRVIGRSFNSPDKNVRDAAGVASGEIGKIIAIVSRPAAENLKKGDAIHSTARSIQDLQRKSDVAELRAGRAGYGGNAVNSMRQVLSPIVQRAVEGRNTGFKPNEIEAMRQIVEGTTATNALRGAGQLSPSKGVIQTVGAGGAMYAVGPGALAIPALGMASNKLATILTGKQIDRLKELVAKRSPAYAQGVAKAVERYSRSQVEFVNNPSANKFAAYLSASRALSAGLNKDGIQVTSGELLKLLQAPAVGRAEQDQQ